MTEQNKHTSGTTMHNIEAPLATHV